jgi:hypothetical protein
MLIWTLFKVLITSAVESTSDFVINRESINEQVCVAVTP